MENNDKNKNNSRRKVVELIEIFDNDNNTKIMTIEKNDTGIVSLMLNYMSTLHNEEVTIFKTMLIKRVFNMFDFHDLLFNEVNNKFINYIESMYLKFYNENPIMLARMNMLCKTYDYVRNYSITNITKIEDLNLYDLKFYIGDEKEKQLVLEYPFIPEILPIIYNDYLHCNNYNKMIIYGIYTDSFVDELRKQKVKLTKEDKMYIDMIRDLTQDNDMYFESVNPDYDKDVSALIYSAYQELYLEPTKYNDIEIFSKELFERYVVLNSKDFFDALEKIYTTYMTEKNINYAAITEDIYDFFDRLGLENEQKCMKNIIEKNSSKYFVNAFYYYLNVLLSSEQYKQLFNDIDNGNNGESRHRDK